MFHAGVPDPAEHGLTFSCIPNAVAATFTVTNLSKTPGSRLDRKVRERTRVEADKMGHTPTLCPCVRSLCSI